MTRRKITVAFISAIVVLTVVIWGISHSIAQDKKSDAPSASAKVATPTVVTTAVVSQELNRQMRLPGELKPYQDVAIYPKVQSFVEWIGVDRGSAVKRGQLLARMSAPELTANRGEAENRVQAASSQRLESESRVRSIREQRLEAIAKLAGDEGTYKRLKKASETPGVVAGNDVDIAEKIVEADRARVRLLEENEKAAQAQVHTFEDNEKAVSNAARSVKDIESYLRIIAPFDGVITERNVHTGSLIGPAMGANMQPMLRLQEVSHLRLVTPVPEAAIAGITRGATVNFSVPAFPGETFTGKVERIGQSIDPKSRTMPVELDVVNTSHRLSPGMYAEVAWPEKRPQDSLFVPPSAVAVTTERSFVIRIKDGVAEWVDVKRGATVGKPGSDLVEVFGNLAEGDQIAVRGTDELREGTRVSIKPAAK